jgi:hypothetical protein
VTRNLAADFNLGSTEDKGQVIARRELLNLSDSESTENRGQVISRANRSSWGGWVVKKAQRATDQGAEMQVNERS